MRIEKKEEKASEEITIEEDVRLPGTDIILEKGDKIRIQEDDLEDAKERMTNWTVELIKTGKGRRGKPLTREEVKELVYFRYSNSSDEVLDDVIDRAYKIVGER